MKRQIMNKEISILVPTINEEENILRIYQLIRRTLKKITNKYEIIFVDDSSIDETIKIISLLQKKNNQIILVKSPKKRGLGNAINLGIKKAKGKYIVCLDCDCPVSSVKLGQIIKLRSENTIVIGSRYLKNSKILGFGKTKIFLSKIINYIVGYLYKIPAKDITHSLRIFCKNTKFTSRVLTHPGYFLEMSVFFKKEKKIFIEVPIIYKKRKYGKTKNNLTRLLASTINFFIKMHIKK
jgi:dolichol-phosphate mannosyltransferase